MKNNLLKRMLFWLIVVGIVVSAGFAQQRQAPALEIQKMSDNLYQLLGGGGANGGFYIGDNGILVIDTKMSLEAVHQTLSEIKKISDKPIIFLVNTHSDGDHIAGNKFFPQSVTIVSHENCRKEFLLPGRDGKPSAWEDPALAPFVPEVTYGKQMNLYLGSKRIELWYFGVGHTTGDSVVYFPEEKTAFIGDQMFQGRPQLIHSYKGGNSFEHVKTLTKMLETLDVETICSGHSVPFDRDTVKKHLVDMKKMQEKVKNLVSQRKNLDEVKAEFAQNEVRLVTSIFEEIKK
ncbi:MBL fold metallo-hydrolase [Acidobacteriota bacterium]